MDQIGTAAIWVLGTLLGTLVGVLLTIVLEEPVQSAAARLAAGIISRGPRNLTGLWKLKYDYVDRGERKNEIQVVVIRSIGGAVFGRTLVSQSHRYEIKGRLRQELYFTGNWHSILPGQAYHGAFQLILHPDGSELSGKWMGFSEKLKTVNHGPWVWLRLSHRVGRAERAKASRQVEQELNVGGGPPSPASR